MRSRQTERCTPLGAYKRGYGEIPEGLTKEWWLECLERIIKATEPHWPERAAELRAEADVVAGRK